MLAGNADHRSEPRLPESGDVTGMLEEIQRWSRVPGIAAAISFRGDRVFGSCGVARANQPNQITQLSSFPISCLMKLCVSLATLELVFAGKIALQSPIYGYCPELKPSNLFEAINVGHLLSHCAGYRSLNISAAKTKWNCTWSDLIEHFNHNSPLFPPGKVFSYEHTDHVILGEIIRRVSGIDAAQVVADLLLSVANVDLKQADMRSRSERVAMHGWSHDKAHRFVEAPMPGFGPFWAASLPDIYLTLAEVLSIGESLVRRYPWGEGRPLSAIAKTAATRGVICLPSQVSPRGNAELLPSSFGYVNGIYANGMVGHNGSTIGSTVALRMWQKEELVVAVGLNAWLPQVRDLTVQRILALMRGLASEQTNSSQAFEMDRLTGGFSLSQLEGTYIGGSPATVHVQLHGRGLSIDVGELGRAQRVITVEPEPDGRFRMDANMPVAVGFLPHPYDFSPVLTISMNAYRKEM